MAKARLMLPLSSEDLIMHPVPRKLHTVQTSFGGEGGVCSRLSDRLFLKQSTTHPDLVEGRFVVACRRVFTH